ncbi:uncharacterized protein LOC130203964 [Pseudoliparis swirei]|uniref:uncharacterized protein LOC130203964 n=1 Tax=Pseudoliparis swirei TaxID=2059687 RepID=UPI0024BE9828|nr:uncharacterized protein LOC130203964 [Pseudoliparis swirei]
MWLRQHFLLPTEAMAAFWALVFCALTVCLSKGSCLSAGGKNERSNALLRRTRELSPNEIKKALALFKDPQSHHSMLLQAYEEVQQETDDVEVEASSFNLKVVKKPLIGPKELKGNESALHAGIWSQTSSDGAGGNIKAYDNLPSNVAAYDNLPTKGGNVTAYESLSTKGAGSNVTAYDSLPSNVTSYDSLPTTNVTAYDGLPSNVTAYDDLSSNVASTASSNVTASPATNVTAYDSLPGKGAGGNVSASDKLYV